jgi:hypothetical protein
MVRPRGWLGISPWFLGLNSKATQTTELGLFAPNSNSTAKFRASKIQNIVLMHQIMYKLLFFNIFNLNKSLKLYLGSIYLEKSLYLIKNLSQEYFVES